MIRTVVGFLLAPALCLCPPAWCQVDERALLEHTELQGYHYWFAERVGWLRNVEQGDEEITGEMFAGMGGWGTFRLKRSEIEAPHVRTVGYRMALKQFMHILGESRGRISARAKFAIGKLSALTGQRMAQPDSWRTWYDENKAYLIWSDKEQLLVVARKAKEAGVPPFKFPKTIENPNQR